MFDADPRLDSFLVV